MTSSNCLCNQGPYSEYLEWRGQGMSGEKGSDFSVYCMIQKVKSEAIGPKTAMLWNDKWTLTIRL